MAVKLLTASALLSTSNGSWARAEAANFSIGLATIGSNDDVYTARTIAVTYANACNATGIYIAYTRSIVAGTILTVKLQENTGSWVDRATATFNVDSTVFPYSSGAKYFPHTPYAVDTSANKWRYQISVSGGTGRFQWRRDATAGNYFYAAIGNADSTRPASGDVMALDQNVALTIDESATLGANQGFSVVLGDSASLLCTNPAASYTWTLSGSFCMFSNYTIKIGASGTPVSVANKFTIACTGVSTLFNQPSNSSWTPDYFGVVELYGAIDTNIRQILSADAASGQAVVATVDDMSAVWAIGDSVKIVGKEMSGADAVIYTISSMSGRNITLNTNLNYKALKGGVIVNLTRKNNLGIWLSSTVSCVLGGGMNDYTEISGVYMENISPSSVVINKTTSTRPSFFKNVLAYVGGFTPILLFSSQRQGLIIENVHYISNLATTTTLGFNNNNIVVSGLTIQGISSGVTLTTGANLLGVNGRYSGLIIANVYAGSENYGALRIGGSGHTFDDLFVLGNNGGLWLDGNVITFNRLKVAYSALKLNNAVGIVINDGDIGYSSPSPAGAYIINWFADTLSRVQMNNTYVGTVIGTAFNTTAPGTWLRMRNRNAVAGDHRSWYRGGIFNSSSGKILAESAIAAEEHYNKYNLTSDNIAGLNCAALVGCQIVNAAYYAGAYTLPKITVTFDSDQTEVATASAVTTRQVLQSVFAPSISYSPIEVKLSQKTDATGTNADVTWDSLTIRARKYGYIFVESVKVITETTDDIVLNIGDPIANSFITESTEATVAAYTGITINHLSGLITVTENHTIGELYDYCQYNLALEANLDKADFFSTIDGLNFTCTYDLTIDGCVVSGAGKAINLGSRDFQAINVGSCTAKITDKDGTLVAVTLTGVMAGSRCRIFKTSDGTEIMNVEASGLTVAVNYNHTSDIDVTIRVRKGSGAPKYLPFETFGTITSNGLSVVVTQVLDMVAA